MAFPTLVRLTRRYNNTIITTDTAMLMRVVMLMDCPARSRVSRVISVGTDLGSELNISINAFCRKILTPMAVINREIRGDPLVSNRWYASFSIRIPTAAQTKMETNTATHRGSPSTTSTRYTM